jgi:hypothetical protein
MRIEGQCDFCGEYGDWEGGLYDDPKSPKDRPADWSAFFPVKRIPDKWKNLAWSASSFCEEHKINTKFACPKCYRK